MRYTTDQKNPNTGLQTFCFMTYGETNKGDFNTFLIPYINLYNVFKNQQNAINSTDIFSL